MHGLVQQSVVEAMMREGTFAFQLCAISNCINGLLPQSEDQGFRRLNDKQVMDLASHVYVASSHILRSRQLDEECWLLLRISCWKALGYEHLKKAEYVCKSKLELVRSNILQDLQVDDK